MSKPDQRRRRSRLQAASVAAETRVDMAHVIQKRQTPDAATAVPVVDAAGVLDQSVVEDHSAAVSQTVSQQLRTQADQLAAHLRARQEEIDHRESHLNARIAQLERDARGARLWLSEREAELKTRNEEISQREAELNSRSEEASQREAELKNRREESIQREADLKSRVDQLARREQELQCQAGDWTAGEALRSGTAETERTLADREEQLRECSGRLVRQDEAQKRDRQQFEADRRRAEVELQYEGQRIEAQREALQQLHRQLLSGVERRRQAVEAWAAKLREAATKASPELLAREDVVRRTVEALQTRKNQLDQAEARLADAQAETQQLQQQLREAQRTIQEEGRMGRQKLVAQQRQVMAELQEQRDAVQRRSDHVDHCHKALEQLRTELGRMHRETLEIRLATEELWVQLSGAAPPAALTRSLGRIRSQLAEHYRQSNAELHEQKKELEEIRGQLLQQYEKVLQQKQQLDGLATARQEEAEQQANRLIAREEQLLRRQSALENQSRDWQAERLRYQRDMERLQLQLAQREESAVPA